MGKRHIAAKLRAVALTLLSPCLLSLPACSPKAKTDDKGDKPPATVAPLAFSKTDGDTQVTLSLPEPIKLYPALHTRLYNDGQKQLTDFLGEAHKDRAQQSADGIDVPGYYETITWNIAAQSTRLLSLYAQNDIFSGGAHPSSTFQALLWDKNRNELINPAGLFAVGADMKAVDAYVCHEVEAERSRRMGEPTTQAASGFSCPKFADSRLILVPSTINGKFGAVEALYAPYEVGSYAEGPYEIRVPQNVLRGALSPEFAGEFGGEAVKDPTLAPSAQDDQ